MLRVVILPLGLLLLAATALSAQVRVFTEFTLIDGTGRPPVSDAVLVVHDGRVMAAGPRAQIPVPEQAEIVRLGGGAYVIPGLINAHGHVTRVSDLHRYAAYGVTTVWSLGDEPESVLAMRNERDTPSPGRARNWASGPVLAPMTPAEAREQVAAAHARGVDVIKIRVDDNLGSTPKMPVPVYQAVIREAHARRLRVATHVYYLADAEELLAAGADFIGHSVRDRPVGDAFARALAASGRCYAPTFMREVSTYVYGETPDFFADPQFLAYADPDWIAKLQSPAWQDATRANTSAQRYRAQLPVAMANLKVLHDAGVPIALGTDSGPTGRFQGYFELMELELMVNAGLTPADALASATRIAARCMAVDDVVGTLEPGKWADFVVLDANPLEDIRNVRRQRDVRIGGHAIALP